MNTNPILTIGPEVAGADTEPATEDRLSGAHGLLLPHAGQVWADVRERPDAWQALQLTRRAVTLGVPVLAWGSGAALLARSGGANLTRFPGGVLRREPRTPLSGDALPDALWGVLWDVLPGVFPDLPEFGVPRGASVLAHAGTHPAVFASERFVALALRDLPPDILNVTLRRWQAQTPAAPSPLTRAELRAALAAFYTDAARDDLIGPVFAQHVSDWDEHLERVTDFWETMLGGRPVYRGNFTGAHANLGVRGEHVRRWLQLFEAACAGTLGERGDELVRRARAMAARLGGKGPGARK